MTILHYTADDLIIAVPVTFEAGASIQSLIGGTVEAKAKVEGGAAINASSATVVDATNARVVFNDGVLPAGVYTLQVRVTVGSTTKTIAEETINVRASL